MGVLPYLLLVLCPIFHLLGHGGHGHSAPHHDHHGPDSSPRDTQAHEGGAS
jgi:hypothetical protein